MAVIDLFVNNNHQYKYMYIHVTKYEKSTYLVHRGGVLSFFLRTYARAQHLQFTPQKYQEFQAPQKIFEIFATKTNTPILYLDLRKDPKMHRYDP